MPIPAADLRRTPLVVAVVATIVAAILLTLSNPTQARADDPDPDPPAPPTRGLVEGRVLDAGRPLADVLVRAVRYDDLSNAGDDLSEAPVATRTDADGRFALPQFTERYLIKVCDAEPESTDCSGDPDVQRFMPTYRGPDGTTDSWLRQTRLYKPAKAGRSVGTITVQRAAVLSGTFSGGGYQAFRILRGNDSVAAYGYPDEDGRYRVELAPGRYRVEADRHNGLNTPAVVPGFRSKLLKLTADRETRLDFTTKPTTDVHGLVTDSGNPVDEQPIVITDRHGRFAATVVTNQEGRFSIESLRPGSYRLAARSLESERMAQSIDIKVRRGVPVRADLELAIGGRLRLTPEDTSGNSWIDAEVRNAKGEVVKAYQGQPGEEGGRVRFSGLPDGRYDVFVRRGLEPFTDEVQEDYPWTSRSVTIADGERVDLGTVVLDQPTTNLTGRLTRGAGIKLTALPADASLRTAYVDGSHSSALAQTWTAVADAQGRYLIRGVVPGDYAVTVSSATVSSENSPSDYASNLAVRHYRVHVAGAKPTADFSAPKGGVVTGRLRYAGNHRPLIAPVGYEVTDRGPEFWPLPTVSKAPAYGKKFRIERLQAGRTTGRLTDQAALADLADRDGRATVDSLTASSRLSEPNTPYWLTAKNRSATVRLGQVTDLGSVDVTVRR